MKKKSQFWGHWLYRIIYSYSSVIHRLYYRKITVVGLEKIPADTPVLFAPNHQNALMDALAVLFVARKPVGFLARADIFKKPAIAKILNLLKILPIYRIRDGVEMLGRNQEVFDNTIEVLNSNTPICILPEGNHEGKKQLRPLKKGIFRIAFQAEASTDFTLNLHIIPVGLDYSDYFNPGSDLVVVFGKPIKVADYADQYRENEQKTVHNLMDLLAESMRSVMIHIPEENHELIYNISEIYEPNVWNTCNVKRHPFNKLTIRQYIVHKATEAFSRYPEKAAELQHELSVYTKKLLQKGLKDCDLQQKAPLGLPVLLEIAFTVLLLPLHLYGMILNYLPYKIPVWLAAKIQDKHFKSSVQFGISLLLFPVYYLLILIAFGLFTEGSLFILLFGISLPVTGLFAFYNYKNMLLLAGKLRLYALRITNIEEYKTIYNERIHLIDLIKTVINS